MKKSIVFLALAFAVTYMGFAKLYENLVFTALPGEVASSAAGAIWTDAAAATEITSGARSGSAGVLLAGNLQRNVSPREILEAVELNPKFRLRALRWQIAHVDEITAERVARKDDVRLFSWFKPVGKGKKLAYFHATVDFTAVSKAVPFMQTSRDCRAELVTCYPVRKRR